MKFGSMRLGVRQNASELLHYTTTKTWAPAHLAMNPTSSPRFRARAAQASDVQEHTPLKKIAVVAFGGNALLRRGEELTMDAQRRNAATAAAAVAELMEQEALQVCITHGNGPQIGLLAQTDLDSGLDVLDAESEGQIGYLLELELENTLKGSHDIVTLLTQVEVDPSDPAFQHPTKPIGRWYDEAEAQRLGKEKGWSVAKDGDQWRRVVASPQPLNIVEHTAISVLLDAGVTVICCGGGGIPVGVDTEKHRRYGVEAVVDKDAASALLAERIHAEWLIMLTDADAIYDPEKWPDEKAPLPSPLKCSDLEAKEFASGSMAPKVQAACSFVNKTGGKAAVGSISDLTRIIKGEKGTVIVSG